MDNTLQIKKVDAIKTYEKANKKHKKLLEDLFGAKTFKKDIIERIGSLDDACNELGVKFDIDALRNAGFTEDEINYRALKIVTKAINEGWKANYRDPNQKKWFPIFKVSPSGFVFYDCRCEYSYPLAGGTSRLGFETEAKARHAGTQFVEYYKKYIL